jgi:hypothetical protein
LAHLPSFGGTKVHGVKLNAHPKHPGLWDSQAMMVKQACFL